MSFLSETNRDVSPMGVSCCFTVCEAGIRRKQRGVYVCFKTHHNILSREWRVIVYQVQTNYHGRPIYYYNQSGAIELLIMGDFHYLSMVVWALSQLKASELYILSYEKILSLRPRPFSKLIM